ncbi:MULTISPECIES: cation:proton antiporter [unclassified Thermotoga]|uniref:cation:proton antiporter n=1 Tax=unclassified Thermotoga TaxID=2631113 RepID=UPI0001600BB8|nr:MULTISPECIES: cation:proton antiporter [unclassified Thermotoga]MBZ4662158.1 putative monovalent cation/H+ antiporter subunit [Thermotoga sp.]ACB10045.1 NADH/Ubiquinone/plastoquinone (complex I) [Thermotoga sp. RQ2]AIY88941.1 putative monovalent cation/H+ antiporter subunit D [Thermotoga sp. Cell2]KHC93109.1 monovalent cation/H+ antiporter subunit D [Thermotoga sp. TBGT1765]KHC94517.1 monovalent cation/H+ antiporter subunit D [Thermotoga sp. TBGT1766]
MIFLVYNFLIISLGIVFLFLKRKAPWWTALVNLVFTVTMVLSGYRFDLVLTGNFGVHLLLDQTSYFFLILTAVVLLAVFTKDLNVSLSNLLLILLGALNLAFVSYDLFNIYVTVEVVSLITFLLVVEGRKKIQYWSAFKYLILGTVGMNLYLIGIGFLYAENGTLSISDISKVDSFASALVAVGLLLRAGVFLFSMWLPQVHSEAETPVSAILSGVVVKSAVYALVRLEHVVNWDVVKIFAIFSALSGVLFAFLSKDYKRILAYSTLSQIGIVLASPVTAPVYALAHGVFKSWLFLLKDELPERDVTKWKRLDFWTWLSLSLASLSIMGLPGLAGFSKNLVLEQLHGWEKIFMEVVFVGTAASFWKFLLKPFEFKKKLPGMYNPVLLIASLTIGLYFASWERVLESFLLMGAGLLVHFLFKNLKIEKYPLEDFESMLGVYLLGVVACLFLSL